MMVGMIVALGPVIVALESTMAVLAYAPPRANSFAIHWHQESQQHSTALSAAAACRMRVGMLQATVQQDKDRNYFDKGCNAMTIAAVCTAAAMRYSRRRRTVKGVEEVSVVGMMSAMTRCVLSPSTVGLKARAQHSKLLREWLALSIKRRFVVAVSRVSVGVRIR